MLKSIVSVLHILFVKLLLALGTIFPKANSMVFVGDGSTKRLSIHIASFEFKRVLIVTDKSLVALGLVGVVVDQLKIQGVETQIFDGVLPDPTNQLVSEGCRFLKANACDAVLAIGGGSSIDAAKVIACLATNDVEPAKLAGYFKVKELPLPLFAIPTTSGTGSEATVGAVISDTQSHQKSILIDHKMMPLCAALDPSLMTALPPAITAATGMDALTHAIEVYICLAINPRIEAYVRHAIKLVFKYLPIAYSDGNDIEAREKMAVAAYYAGLAINEVNVGNVHAVVHQLGARYGVAHGLANAMVLPHVLEYSKSVAQDRLAELAQLLGLTEPNCNRAKMAQTFIDEVTALNVKVGIPSKLDKLKEEDIPAIAWSAVKEGAGYCAPVVMLPADARAIIRCLL